MSRKAAVDRTADRRRPARPGGYNAIRHRYKRAYASYRSNFNSTTLDGMGYQRLSRRIRSIRQIRVGLRRLVGFELLQELVPRRSTLLLTSGFLSSHLKVGVFWIPELVLFVYAGCFRTVAAPESRRL